MHAQLCCIPDVKKSRAIVRKALVVSHLKGGGAFVTKIIFCFLSENECLNGMELVYIF